MNTKQLQYGSFIPVPMAYESSGKTLSHVIKFEFKTVYSEESKQALKLEDVFFTDRFLVDLSAISANEINSDKISKDCDFIKNIVQNHPDKISKIIQAMQESKIQEATDIVNGIGFTENASVKAGGGMIGLIAVVLAAVALSGCAHCGGEQGRKPVNAEPQK